MPRKEPLVVRTKYGCLNLFDRAVTALRTESAAESRWSLTYGDEDVEIEEPPREAYRSYLMAVRAFLSPTEDIFLRRIFKTVESFDLQPDTRRWVVVQKSIYRRSKSYIAFGLSLNGERYTPHTCFELLAYTEDLHYNAEYEALKRGMDKADWQIVRMHGSQYASAVANAAIILRALARDDPATAHWFVPREPGKESAVEWLEANSK